MDTKTILRDFILHEFGGDRSDKQLDDDANLLASGILDSLGLFRLVELIPERWGFTIPDEDVVLANFKSIRTIAAYLDRRREDLGHEPMGGT